ncbi:MAG: tetratricopeptide repeat protein [Deltaproteobacteria bacterium]|nr:tetratricopeptide repeat protein [Deltaproteobacteria bacterium]
MDCLAVDQNAGRIEEAPYPYHSVEVELAGMIYPYQFKIRSNPSSSMCFLIKENSDILPRLKVGDILELKYYSAVSAHVSEPRKTVIREITRDDQGPFKGHFLVGLEIIEQCPDNNKQEPPERLSEREMFRTAREFFRRGKYREAIDIYTSIIDENPNQAVSYFNRGVTYKKLGKNSEAIEDLKTSAVLGIERGKDFLNSNGILYESQWEPSCS